LPLDETSVAGQLYLEITFRKFGGIGNGCTADLSPEFCHYVIESDILIVPS
jgi:hypothetical protein